ncbi:predicted protein [Thalassiosira pseudonana CCMP1335]|uniref:Uncharacterized protein n=1 Tax=Thalassiosira pseudonana TaxID=35128 RepID=B8CG62_THAPS|nr:predicted protein [Thalassiosira pseudonana CCMP1335]EED87434.1 predicted protein [Thalassiosira pseudonana CCMP1335]|eukprot:scaffold906_cov186-Alexandrium_tamarense.AAC.13
MSPSASPNPNAAIYDPQAKCIRFPTSPNGVERIDGSIVQIVGNNNSSCSSDFLSDSKHPPRMLLGEVMEITIMDERMGALDVDSTLSQHPAQQTQQRKPPISTCNTNTKLTQEQLHQKQHTLHSTHNSQSQSLIHRHHNDRQALIANTIFNQEEKAYITMQMEQMHHEELVELQERQMEEMEALMNLVFQCVDGGDDKGERHQQEENTTSTERCDTNAEEQVASSNATPLATKPAPPKKSTAELVSELRREEIQTAMKDKTMSREEKQKKLAEIKARYSALRATAVEPPARAATTPTITGVVATPKRTAGLWNEATVATVAVNRVARKYHPSPPIAPSDVEATLPKPSASRTFARWNKAAVFSATATAIGSGHPKEEKEAPQVSKPPQKINYQKMDLIVQQLKLNDPTLTSLVLDGRNNITADDWKALFQSLEENSQLQYLSIDNCRLTDEVSVSLVLALVENETITSINLGNNQGLTDDTGKGLVKVLKRSNHVIKQLDVTGTKISAKVQMKLQTYLDDRDENVQFERLQEARKLRIERLLSFSASDTVEQPSEESVDEDAEVMHGSKMVGSGKSPSKKSSKAAIGSASTVSHASGGSRSSRTGSKGSRKPNRRSSLTNSVTSNESGPLKASIKRPAKANKDVYRSVALQMASLGADVATGVGSTANQMKELRKMRGECEHCGQKCFEKRMFKTTPLTIPNAVFEGRCLKCKPMS